MNDDFFWFVLVRNINIRWWSSCFHITSVIVPIEFIRSHHTLCKFPDYMKVAGSRLMFGPLILISKFPNSLKLFDNLRKILLTDISDGIPCPFLFWRHYFGLESQSGYQPLSWSSKFSFWLWICGFHLVHTVKLCWDIQGDDLVTALDLLVFPNFATTTIFHVHRLKQILLTCELFLPERLPSGATMINRRWWYSY